VTPPPAAATAAGGARSLRRSPAPRVPRRVSGPARKPRVAPAPRRQPLAARLRRLPDARLLDRLIRGRAWIVVIGVLLMGIVVMQVSLLKLNTGIGRAVEATSTLERKNSALRLSVSRLSSGERIQRMAERMGMVMPQPDNVRYLTVRGDRDARSAVMNMRIPNPQADQLAAVDEQAALNSATTPTTDPIAPSRDPKPLVPQTQGQEGTTGTPADTQQQQTQTTAGANPAAGTGGTTTTTTTTQQQQQTAPTTTGGATVAPPVGG
jgi:cell division protein FtsL